MTIKKPITVKFPPDLFQTVLYSLNVTEKQLLNDTDITPSVRALMVSDLIQARRVMRGIDRFDDSHDDQLNITRG